MAQICRAMRQTASDPSLHGSITTMGAEPNIETLIREIKAARQGIESRDQKTIERVDEIERSINEVLLGMRRPSGTDFGADDGSLERKSAITMCQDRHAWRNQKIEGRFVEYAPGGSEIDEAINAQRAWKALLHHDDIQRLDDIERKSLSAFSFGSTGWVVPPQVSSRILSCLTDPNDVLSMFSQETISAGSIQYPIDNVEMQRMLRPVRHHRRAGHD